MLYAKSRLTSQPKGFFPLRIPVFLLGGGPNGLAVARSMGRRSIPVYLFGTAEDDIACRSRYVTKNFEDESHNPTRLLEQLVRAARAQDERPVLMYTMDRFLEFSSEHRNMLQEVCRLNLPSVDSVNVVLDKGLFGRFCRSRDLPIPMSWAPGNLAEVESCASEARFPVVIKPVFAHETEEREFSENGQSAKMVLATSAEQLIGKFRDLNALGIGLLVQEYIDGPDDEHYSYCSYRDSQSRETAAFGVRKIRILPIHAGVGTFAEICDDPELVDLGRRVADELQYRGVSSICFKRDIRDGHLVLHEANGRFPMVHSAGLLCGVDLPYAAYMDASGEVTDNRQTDRSSQHGAWVLLNSDISSFRSYRAANELTTWHWLKSLARVRLCVEFALDDLRPFLSILSVLKQRARRKLIGSPGNAPHE